MIGNWPDWLRQCLGGKGDHMTVHPAPVLSVRAPHDGPTDGLWRPSGVWGLCVTVCPQLTAHEELPAAEGGGLVSPHGVLPARSFGFSISPSGEYSGLISFRTDWFDLLAVQGPLKSLLQHHSSKASILWRSAFLVVQL